MTITSAETARGSARREAATADMTHTTTSRTSAATRHAVVCFLLFALIASAGLVVLYNTMRPGTEGATRTYSAIFLDANGLRAGDDVRLAGVKVGDVSSIEVDEGKARVEFAISDEVTLRTDTGLVLRYQNLIGQRYLAVLPGKSKGDPLGSRTTIAVDRTSAGFDLTTLLNGFRPLFQVLEPADVNKLAESVVKVLQGEGGTIESLLTETTELTNYLANQDELFNEVADNLTPVLDQVSGDGVALVDTIDRLEKLTRGLARDRAVLGTSVESIGLLLAEADRVLAQARRPLAADLQALRKVVRLYASHSGDYVKATPALARLLAALGRTGSYRSALNTYLCDVTIAAGTVSIPTTVPGGPRSELCK